jgi:hypothetical protein
MPWVKDLLAKTTNTVGWDADQLLENRGDRERWTTLVDETDPHMAEEIVRNLRTPSYIENMRPFGWSIEDSPPPSPPQRNIDMTMQSSPEGARMLQYFQTLNPVITGDVNTFMSGFVDPLPERRAGGMHIPDDTYPPLGLNIDLPAIWTGGPTPEDAHKHPRSGTYTGRRLFTTMLHELGHAQGLDQADAYRLSILAGSLYPHYTSWKKQVGYPKGEFGIEESWTEDSWHGRP